MSFQYFRAPADTPISNPVLVIGYTLMGELDTSVSSASSLCLELSLRLSPFRPVLLQARAAIFLTAYFTADLRGLFAFAAFFAGAAFFADKGRFATAFTAFVAAFFAFFTAVAASALEPRLMSMA